MRIVQFHAENFKRLGLVEITPEGNLITIGGKNGHGKSSVLDAIYVALKGRAVAPPKPIRKGCEKCTIKLDLGDLIITRNFHEKDGGTYTDTIKVEDTEGRRYGEPQKVLNALLGEVGFDPFEFINLPPAKQTARLLEMVPLSIDLDEFAKADKADVADRRDVNRDIARLKAQLDAIPEETVPDDAPDRAALTDQLANAADTNAEINNRRARREALEAEAVALIDGAGDIDQRIERLEAEIAELKAEAAGKREQAANHRERLANAEPLPDFIDTDEIRQKLREAEATQALIERQNQRKALAETLAKFEAKSKAYTDALAAREAERNAALAAAELPVPGLSFSVDDDGDATLLYEGLPFDKDQISTAIQLRVSTAIGMATNPRLRVLRIMDGSLLDSDSMAMLSEMAEAEDFQLWVEVVGDGGVGIVMENGTIRGADQAEPDGEAQAAEKPAKKTRKPKAEPEPEPETGDTKAEDAPAGRQYVEVKFNLDSDRSYTYHADGLDLDEGDEVDVQATTGKRSGVVVATGLAKPAFTTRAVLGLATGNGPAQEALL